MTHQIDSGLSNADAVVQAFSDASMEFDADILDAYLKTYPDYEERLKSYAQVWLMSVPAAADDIADTAVPADRMLRAQSRMLMAWESGFTAPEAADPAEAAKALGQFAGDQGLKNLTSVLFDSEDEDEGALAMEYLDMGLSKVPRRIDERLAGRIGCSVAYVAQAMATYRSQAQSQTHYSARDKPEVARRRTWAEAVNDLPVSDERKKELLQDNEK